jgi:branched-chain amino acid transport system substrate-binding protein
MKKTIITIMLLTILAISLSACNTITGNVVSERDDIRIGFIGPLSGGTATFGIVEKNAVELAVKEINENNGINGKKVKVFYEDGKCSPKEAINAANKLINIDNVDIMFTVCSSETLAVAPITEEKKMILVTAYAMHPEVSEAGDYVFRFSYSDISTSEMIADYVDEKGFSSLGIIYEQDAYAVSLKNLVEEKFENKNGIVYTESFPKDDPDVRTQVSKILEKNPEAIFIDPASLVTGLNTLKTIKESGYEGLLMGNFFASSKEVLEAPEAKGLIYFGDPEIEENPLKRELFEAYKKEFGEYPQIEYSATTRYDSIIILKQAIEEKGLDSEKIRDHILSNTFERILGTYGFDENGDLMGTFPKINQIS